MDSEVLETKVGGLRAVDMYYRGIREFESGEISFLQSKTRLNTPDLGTLMPETYRKVAELSNQCVSLFELELTQLFETIKNLQNRDYYFRWISVYMPLKYLGMRGVQQKLMSMMDESGVDTNRVCFELSPDLLISGTSVHGKNIEQLRNRGFHFMLTEFGGVNSPLMRLAYFPVDYVLMSEEIMGYLKDETRALAAVESISGFIEDMGSTPIADGVTRSDQADLLYRAHCYFGSGPLVGKYVQERYLRRKSLKDDDES